MIPVTYGLGYEAIGAPKGSYIDVFDFPSVESVAKHILYLDKNDTAYNEYFRLVLAYILMENLRKYAFINSKWK